MIFLVVIMLLLQELGQIQNWFLPVILVLLAIGSGLLFWHVEQNSQDPILPVSILKNKQFLGINVVTLLISGFLIGFEFYLPIWMQGILGEPATAAGFAVTPSSILWILGSFVTGHLLTKISIQKNSLSFAVVLAGG